MDRSLSHNLSRLEIWSETMSIPIYMLGSSGVASSTNPLMAPCINCLVVNPKNGEKHASFALLDSGAYPNVISAALAERMELEVVGSDTLHAALAIERTYIHTAELVVEGLLGTFPIRFQAANHHMNGHPYELVLGRQFLTAFDFGFSQATQEWYLAYPEN